VFVQGLDRPELLVASAAGQLIVDDPVDGGLALLATPRRPEVLHQAVLVGERVLAFGAEEAVAGWHERGGTVGPGGGSGGGRGWTL